MKYDRQDSNAKAKSGKEPQKLDFSMLPPKGYKNTLDTQEQKRMKRKEALLKAMNKIHDPDIA